MNAILFLVVFWGALVALWIYPVVRLQTTTGARQMRPWFAWVPLANLCLLRPIAKTAWGALLTVALTSLTFLVSLTGALVVHARYLIPVHDSVPIVIAALWLIGIVSCLTALRWSITSCHEHFWPAMALAVFSSGIGYLGVWRVFIQWSQIVNGQMRWGLDTRWLFVALLVLTAGTLVSTLWRRSTINPMVNEEEAHFRAGAWLNE